MRTEPAPAAVTEEHRRRAPAVAAAVVAAALVLGGSTVALWSAQTQFDGGTITAGDLDLRRCGGPQLFDVSDDRADATNPVPWTDGSRSGHPIDDQTTWRTVAGDSVAVAYCLDITLEGDNMVGRLWTDGLPVAQSNTETSYTYELYRAGRLLLDERPLVPVAPGTLGTGQEGGTIAYLAATETGQADGQPDAEDQTPVYQMDQTTEQLGLVIYATFSSDATGNKTVTDTIGALTVNLEQVRHLGDSATCEWDETLPADDPRCAPPIFQATVNTAQRFGASSCASPGLNLGGVGPGTTIDWGDGTTSTARNGLNSHGYSAGAIYQITVNGTFTEFGGRLHDMTTVCFVSVDRWEDTVGTISIDNGFRDWIGLVSTVEPPSTVTSMDGLFMNAQRFNQDIGHWDMSNLTSTRQMFSKASNFNNGGAPSINNWDMSNVTSMSGMFESAAKFNQPLDRWDTSKVTDMGSMFFDTGDFDQDIGGWDVGSVRNMTSMFGAARSFNNGGSPSIAEWNTSSVTNMTYMFGGASEFATNNLRFNQPIGSWDVSSVSPVNYLGYSGLDQMFAYNNVFDQDLRCWDVRGFSRAPKKFTDRSRLGSVNSIYYSPGPPVVTGLPVWGTSGCH